MTYEQAKEIASELTEMSITGEYFIAEPEDFREPSENSRFVIERYNDEGLVDTMTIERAIGYANVFALGGSMKVCDALQFLRKHGRLDECKRVKHSMLVYLETALDILSQIED